jgi:hypothetical protein
MTENAIGSSSGGGKQYELKYDCQYLLDVRWINTQRQSSSTELYVSQQSSNEYWDGNVMTSHSRMRSYLYVDPQYSPSQGSYRKMSLICRGTLDIALKEKIILP